MRDPSSMIYRIGPPFTSLCPVAGVVPKLGLVQLFPMLLATVSRGVSSYCHRYSFSDRVQNGCEVAGCAAKTSFSSYDLLREAMVTTSSSIARDTMLHDLPLTLGSWIPIAHL